MSVQDQSSVEAGLQWLPRGEVVAVLRTARAALLDPVVETLAGAGIRSIELTLTTPGVLEHLGQLRDFVDPAVRLGVGTVLTAEQATAAIAAGADYLVTPSLAPEALAVAVEAHVPVLGGAMTPTEVQAQWSSGASAVKLFPAQTVGPAFVKHLHGPFPGLPLVPSGGVDLTQVVPWLEAGARAVSLGGPLLGDATREGGDLLALARRSREVLGGVEQWLEGRA
jgi:2-dehydro-3-deoxyphosphogluconate aldolase / (4S)-4-hydroxy-2-oxoglutarate aldolase